MKSLADRVFLDESAFDIIMNTQEHGLEKSLVRLLLDLLQEQTARAYHCQLNTHMLKVEPGSMTLLNSS